MSISSQKKNFTPPIKENFLIYYFFTSIYKKLSVKCCESQNIKIAEEALKNVLDVILTIGITSRVNEVKAIR